MEVLAILFWLVVLGADVAFMIKIPAVVREIEGWLDKKRPGGAGTPTEACQNMTQAVYHFTKEMSKVAQTKAVIIKMQGDKQICGAVAQSFESPQLQQLRLENAALRRNRDALRAAELRALEQQIEARFYGRRVIWRAQQAFWRWVGSAVRLIRKGGARR